MKLRYIGAMLMIMSPLNVSVANAQDAESEARYLISIVNEIENVKALAQKSSASADASQRLHFNYTALQKDLDDMQKAIEKHVAEPSRSPRVIPAINADYTGVTANE